METRKPKKGQGVPKETPSHNNIAALRNVLSKYLPQVSWDGLEAALEERGFFEAGMQQQVRIMAQAAADTLGEYWGEPALIKALARSPVEKIRGVRLLPSPLFIPMI